MEEYRLSNNIIISLVIAKGEKGKSLDDLFELKYESELDYKVYLSRELLYYIFRDSIMQIITLGVPVTYGPIEVDLDRDEKVLWDRVSDLILYGNNIPLDLEKNDVSLFQDITILPDIDHVNIEIKSKCLFCNKDAQLGRDIEMFKIYFDVEIKDIISLIENLTKNTN